MQDRCEYQPPVGRPSPCDGTPVVTFKFHDVLIRECLTHACHTIVNDNRWQTVRADGAEDDTLRRR